MVVPDLSIKLLFSVFHMVITLKGLLEKAYRQGAAKVLKPPTLPRLIRAVCKDYGFKPSDLSIGTRQRGPAEARAVVGLLAVELGSSNLTEVGKRFGRDVVTMS